MPLTSVLVIIWTKGSMRLRGWNCCLYWQNAWCSGYACRILYISIFRIVCISKIQRRLKRACLKQNRSCDVVVEYVWIGIRKITLWIIFTLQTHMVLKGTTVESNEHENKKKILTVKPFWIRLSSLDQLGFISGPHSCFRNSLNRFSDLKGS